MNKGPGGLFQIYCRKGGGGGGHLFELGHLINFSQNVASREKVIFHNKTFARKQQYNPNIIFGVTNIFSGQTCSELKLVLVWKSVCIVSYSYTQPVLCQYSPRK